MNKRFTPLKVSAPVRSCPEPSIEETRRDEKLRVRNGNRAVDIPSPYLPVQREVWQILVGALHSLSENDHGRPWPYPVRQRIARLTTDHDAALCIRAARQAREIVQSQDRAPNITGLFEKKLRDLVTDAEHRAEVRKTVRDSLGAAA